MIAIAQSAVLDSLPRIMTNIDAAELDVVRRLFATWQQKYPGNVVRSTYYDAKMPFKPTGNIPQEASARIRAVLDWPEKSVTGLAERNVFDGFVAPGSGQDPFELQAVLDANRFDLELPQAINSAYKHSCSFITTLKGDAAAGEPSVLVMARSAEWSAGIWDRRRRAVSAFLAISDTDELGRPSAMDVYLPHVVLVCTRRPSGSWTVDRKPSLLGEVLAEPMTYDAQLDRPFGRSRISRPVMSITDSALRTIVRTEIGADFYAAPRMVALGVTSDAFTRGKWQAAIDRWFAISRDENGDVPTVQQMPQMSTQPLTELYRMYASQIAGATGMPISSFGIVQDNPPSAEALYAAEKDLIVKARRTNREFGASLRQVAKRIVMLRDGKDSVTDELRQIQANWQNPAFTSPITSAVALRELSTTFPWLGETEVALSYAGFTGAEITRLLENKRRSEGSSNLAALVAAAQAPRANEEARAPTAPADPNAQANELKAKFDALGVAIRAGVDPTDAANRLGLAGIQFTGAVPVSLRMPSDEASEFEEK